MNTRKDARHKLDIKGKLDINWTLKVNKTFAVLSGYIDVAIMYM